MEPIVDPSLPQTLVQQRIRFAARAEPPPLYFLENVPQWDATGLELPPAERQALTTYADCEGEEELREAICGYENGKYPLGLTPEQVLVTNGGLHGLSLIFRAHAAPGGVALCQYPVLKSIADLLRTCGYCTVPFSAEDDPAVVERMIAGAGPSLRLIYLNTPNNPTGRIASPNLTDALLHLACERAAALVADLVYDGFQFGAARVTHPLLHAEVGHCCYAVNSMSKNFGAPGLRIGWVITHPDHMARLAGRLETECVAVCGTAQRHATHLLRQGNAPLVQKVRENLATVCDLLSAMDGISFEAPEGGTQAFIHLPLPDIEAFADHLLRNHGLLLATSGNYEGCKTPALRIPLGYDPDFTRASLERLEAALQERISPA